MMGRTCSLVFFILLGVVSSSLSEELYADSARDDIGQNGEVFPTQANQPGLVWNFFTKIKDLFLSKMDNYRTDETDDVDTLDRVSSTFTSEGRRSKRSIFNPFAWFYYWRRYFICLQLSRWRPVTNFGANDKQWTQVLATDEFGNATSGDKADLREAVRMGARIKFRANQFTFSYFAEVQTCEIINEDVCCQNIHIVRAVDWDDFLNDTYFMPAIVCTTGNVHVVNHCVGDKYISELKISLEFIWFVYRRRDGTYPAPLLSLSSSGIVTSGSQRAVENVVRAGESLTVVRDNTGVLPIQNVQLREGTVSAQHVWSLGLVVEGDHLEFSLDLFWSFNLFTTSGSRDIARWIYENHTLVNQTKDVASLKWYAGEDWIEAFTTCSPFYGLQSRFFLKSIVEAGVPIKVRFGQTYVEVDNVMIAGDQVSAQVIGVLSREDARTFKSDLNWEFTTLSTTGIVRTYRPLVGSSTMSTEGTTTISQDITWYYDSRRWGSVLHISDSGTVLSGSVQAVRNAVDNGADIRVGYREVNDQVFRYQTADSIFVDQSPQRLSVQLVRLLRDKRTSADDFELDNKPAWSFRYLNTMGIMRKSEWIVGEYTNVGQREVRVEIKFFSSR